MKAEQIQLKEKILEIIKLQQQDTFLSVICGVPKDFSELKIHFTNYPEYFAAMRYAQSKTIQLENLIDSKSSKIEKIKFLAESIRDASLDYCLNNQSNCIPYILIAESEDSPDPFYDTDVYPCGLSGTTENYFKSIYIGIERKSFRHEIVLVGDKNILAVSIDNLDSKMIQAAGLENDYKSSPFGTVTYISQTQGLTLSIDKSYFFIRKNGSIIKSWSFDKPFIW